MKQPRHLLLFWAANPGASIGMALWLGYFCIALGCSDLPLTQVVSQKLFVDHPGILRGNFTGAVGCSFLIGTDHDVSVTHLGFFDSEEDGLQLEHRVGLFEAEKESVDVKPLAEVSIPWGKAAPLDDGYRWVALDKPVTLKAGERYVVVAEVMSGVGDAWPDRLCPRTVALSGERQQRNAEPEWNTYFVGDQPPETRMPRWARKEWPALPEVERPESVNSAFGAANIGYNPSYKDQPK